MSLQIRTPADDFLKAYQVLKVNYSTASLSIMGPSIICLAFAVELYLKDLYSVLREKASRTHNIYKLFEKLPLEVQQEIFNHKSISQNPFMIRGNDFSTKYFDPRYSPYGRFVDQIKAISDGFEKWRYSFESVALKYDSSFALAFKDAVSSTGDKMRWQKQTVFENSINK